MPKTREISLYRNVWNQPRSLSDHIWSCSIMLLSRRFGRFANCSISVCLADGFRALSWSIATIFFIYIMSRGQVSNSISCSCSPKQNWIKGKWSLKAILQLKDMRRSELYGSTLHCANCKEEEVKETSHSDCLYVCCWNKNLIFYLKEAFPHSGSVHGRVWHGLWLMFAVNSAFCVCFSLQTLALSSVQPINIYCF